MTSDIQDCDVVPVTTPARLVSNRLTLVRHGLERCYADIYDTTKSTYYVDTVSSIERRFNFTPYPNMDAYNIYHRVQRHLIQSHATLANTITHSTLCLVKHIPLYTKTLHSHEILYLLSRCIISINNGDALVPVIKLLIPYIAPKRNPHRVCKVRDCNLKHYANDFCRSHYDKDRRAK